MRSNEDDLRRVLQSAYEFKEFPHPSLLARISAGLKSDVRPAGQMSWVAGAATAALAIIVVGAFVGFQRLGTVAPSHRTQPAVRGSEAGVVAILANNHLTYIPPGADKPQWEVAIGPPADLSISNGYSGLGRRVASSPDGNQIYALPARDFNGGVQLVIVDSATGRVVREVALPNPGGSARYGALTVGASGDVWIVGYAGPVASESDLRFKRIEILRVNHQNWSITSWLGRDMSHWVPQGPVPGDFRVYEVQVTNDEMRVNYSYTGGLLHKAGLDWVDLAGTRATTCVPATRDAACILGLAGFLVQGSTVFITTAMDSPTGAINYYGLDGVLRDHVELGLLPGFLEDFTVSPDGNSLYLFGSCGYSGGMAKLDLATKKSTVIVKARSLDTQSADPPCGQSSVFVSGNLIAVGYVARLLPSRMDGRILYVDSATGTVSKTVAVSAEAISIAAVGKA
jgi:hypothetical protein